MDQGVKAVAYSIVSVLVIANGSRYINPKKECPQAVKFSSASADHPLDLQLRTNRIKVIIKCASCACLSMRECVFKFSTKA